jgi:hypothetical protein
MLAKLQAVGVNTFVCAAGHRAWCNAVGTKQ